MLSCGITMGDPGGIGPEVISKALRKRAIKGLANFIVIGNSLAFAQTVTKQVRSTLERKGIVFYNVGRRAESVLAQAGSQNAILALDCLQAALELIKRKKIDVLVTAPVNKHTMSQAGLHFSGHTEYLASATKTKNFAMMLVGKRLKVALVTRHLPLRDVPASITREQVYRTIILTSGALKKYFAINQPRIGVCGLNPHSGEAGVLGAEENRIILPAVQKAKRWARVEGPLPADTLFYFAYQGRFDAVVAMYHDQGLIPLKMLSFHQGVNLTLGLPFVRTSPDHGTAYDIAGKDKANPGSMIEAIKLAVKIGLQAKSLGKAL